MNCYTMTLVIRTIDGVVLLHQFCGGTVEAIKRHLEYHMGFRPSTAAVENGYLYLDLRAL